MSDDMRESIFNAAMIARTKALREARGWIQAEMAAHLVIPLHRYKKYETRTPLPHYLVEPFAAAVGCDPDFVLTGKPSRRSRHQRDVSCRLARRES